MQGTEARMSLREVESWLPPAAAAGLTRGRSRTAGWGLEGRARALSPRLLRFLAAVTHLRPRYEPARISCVERERRKGAPASESQQNRLRALAAVAAAVAATVYVDGWLIKARRPTH